MRGTQSSLSIKIASAALAAGMAIASSAAWAGGGDDRFRLDVRLSSIDSLASAHGRWEIRRNRLKASLEAEDLTGTFATAMLSCPGDTNAAPMVIQNIPIVDDPQPGFFDLNLDIASLEGVPDCVPGDVVSIITNSNPPDMISGTFTLK